MINNYIERSLIKRIESKLQPNKVVIIFGARRVGKTELLKKILQTQNEEYLLLNGEDQDTIEILNKRSVDNYTRLLGGRKLLVVDEAQEIPEIGRKLKLMVDNIEGLKIIASGSSVFDLSNQTGEPLVGRSWTFKLFPIAQMELNKQENLIEIKSRLDERLIFGSYPELINLPLKEDKIQYLKEQVNSYLLKDILSYEGIKKRDKILQLLQKIAFRVGKEISLEGLGKELQISKNTVERYLDLLSQVFVLYKVTGFSRNLDNEITKKNRWYFYDNGIRNAVISSFNSLELRDDVGDLWENYLASERLKYQEYQSIHCNNYFWRTHSRQEIDWIEETDGGLKAFEFKWNTNKKVKCPKLWEKNYPNSEFHVINPDNYLDFIS